MLERFLNCLCYEKRGLLSAPSAELLQLFGATSTAAGASVTSESIFNSPTATAAIRTISDSIGVMPVHLYRRGPNNSKERITDHPAARLMDQSWNDWSSAAEGKMAVQIDALTRERGFGCAQVLRANGLPRELHPLDPRAVSVE